MKPGYQDSQLPVEVVRFWKQLTELEHLSHATIAQVPSPDGRTHWVLPRVKYAGSYPVTPAQAFSAWDDVEQHLHQVMRRLWDEERVLVTEARAEAQWAPAEDAQPLQITLRGFAIADDLYEALLRPDREAASLHTSVPTPVCPGFRRDRRLLEAV